MHKELGIFFLSLILFGISLILYYSSTLQRIPNYSGTNLASLGISLSAIGLILVFINTLVFFASKYDNKIKNK